MRRFATFLTLLALVFTAACEGDGEPSAKIDTGNVGATGATQNDAGVAQTSVSAAPIEVEITADGFDPASAETIVGQELNFNNNDSKRHTIIVPAGDEHAVKAGETFTYKIEGCCGATFTDKETGAKFGITVFDVFDD
jgi:plastocyanin